MVGTAWRGLSCRGSNAGAGSRRHGSPVRYEKAIEWTRQFIRDTMRVLGAPGASITVVKDGHVIWSEGFGMADLEQQSSGDAADPLPGRQCFKAAYFCRSGPAGGGAQARPRRANPEIRAFVSPETVAHYHPSTGGSPRGDPALQGGRVREPEALCDGARGPQDFQDDTLLFQPGTKYSYSSYGWNLIAAVIEGPAANRSSPSCPTGFSAQRA